MARSQTGPSDLQRPALRRVAGLVAGGAASSEVFAAVAEEVARVTGTALVQIQRFDPDDTVTVAGAWGAAPHPFQPGTKWSLEGSQIAAPIKRTGKPVRIDDFSGGSGHIQEGVRETRIRGGAGAPILVDGRVWGAMAAGPAAGEPVPEGLEHTLAEFTELVATAISNTASREALARMADEQAALRRVATLVANGEPPRGVFEAVAREIGELLAVGAAHLGRCEIDGSVVAVATWSRDAEPAPIDAPSSVSVPIAVEDRLWGAVVVCPEDDAALSPEAEDRIAAFAELVATAISNAEARAEVARLADEQAALRRVATLVARQSSPAEVLGAVAEEVARLLDTEGVGMLRFEADGTATLVAQSTTPWDPIPLGTRLTLEGQNFLAPVLRTGKPARMDDWTGASGSVAGMGRTLGIRSGVATPIVVEGRLWGAMASVSQRDEPLPPDTEARVAEFTELVSTAISNAEARAELSRLAEEQAALRRVATLVAEARPSEEVFAAVAEEVGRVLRVEDARIIRYELDGSVTVTASWGSLDSELPVGTRIEVGGENIVSAVLRTGRAARKDGYDDATGALGSRARELGVQSAVGTPIVVGGRLWGAMVVSSMTAGPLPAGLEDQIEEFTQLVGTAISNIEARSDLAASRARIVAAADDERRRVVRDLHDGAQQRLVHTVVTLKMADRAFEQGSDARPFVAEALGQAERANVELRELAHGILPTVLAHGGLRAGVDALASRSPVPVEVAVTADRLPRAVEATAYFVVAEALTNVAKHARAERAVVDARVEDETLHVSVSDDGVGGARPSGSGLVGLRDRVAAIDGRLWLESPPGRGTVVGADIPLSR
jgi:signal transduction histidine kinase